MTLLNDKPKVVILGGGPGAVFAYYGALAAGFGPQEVEIWAKELTYPPGAFWLHEMPPNSPIHLDPVDLKCNLQGDKEGYSRKQWGEVFPTSVDKFAGLTVKAYDPTIALPLLWEQANVKIMDVKWKLSMVYLLAIEIPNVIVTFPITPEAINEMSQRKVPVYVADTANLRNYCIYNGNIWMDWVRLTRAFGRLSIEFPCMMANDLDAIRCNQDDTFSLKGKVQLVPELHPKVQPIPDTVLGWNRNILLTGRWATLRRGALSHDSWKDTVEFLSKPRQLSLWGVEEYKNVRSDQSVDAAAGVQL